MGFNAPHVAGMVFLLVIVRLIDVLYASKTPVIIVIKLNRAMKMLNIVDVSSDIESYIGASGIPDGNGFFEFG